MYRPRTGAGSPGDLITRRIAGTDELVPAIGLGTFMTFDIVPATGGATFTKSSGVSGKRRARIEQPPLYGMAEVNLGDFATSLGITDQMFVTNKIWATVEFLADDSHAVRSLKLSMERLWRDRMDVMQCHSLINVEVIVPMIQAWKKEGHVRYVGATHHVPDYFEALADLVERGDLNFVQVHYSIHTRVAEKRLLPAAADRGVAVSSTCRSKRHGCTRSSRAGLSPPSARNLVSRPGRSSFSNGLSRTRRSHAPLPATSNPNHLMENVGAMRGPLPDGDMSARMVRHMESIPRFCRLVNWEGRLVPTSQPWPGLSVAPKRSSGAERDDRHKLLTSRR